MLIDMARYLAKFVFFFISEIIIKCDLAVSRQHCHWLTVITVAKHNFSLLWMLMTTKHRDHLKNTLKGPPWDLWNWRKLIKVTRNHDQKHKKVTKDSETKTMKSICFFYILQESDFNLVSPSRISRAATTPDRIPGPPAPCESAFNLMLQKWKTN